MCSLKFIGEFMSLYRIGDIHKKFDLSDFTPANCSSGEPGCEGVQYRATNRSAKIKKITILTNLNKPNPLISIEIQLSIIHAKTIEHQLKKLTTVNPNDWLFPLVSGGNPYHIHCVRS